jgi:phage baseplate assembly protein gpV
VPDPDQVLVSRRPEVKLNGSPFDPDNLIEIEIEHDMHLPSSCVLTFNDETMDEGDAVGTTAKIGDDVVVMVNQQGPGGAPVAYVGFTGVVVALERAFSRVGQQVKIQCYDKSYKLHVGRETKAYANVSDSALFNQICSAAGLSATPDPSLSGPVYEHLLRFDQTDWEFLRGRAAERGLVLRMMGPGSIAATPTLLKVDKPVLTGPSLHAGPGIGDGLTLFEFNPRRTAGGPLKNVKVFGWDWKQKVAITGKAGPPTGKESATITADAAKGLSDAGFDQGEMTLTNRVIDTQPEADNVAKSALEQMGATFAEADGICEGDARIVPGQVLEIEHMGTEWNGKWVVNRVRHIFESTEGFQSYFSVGGRNDRSLLGLVTRGLSNGPGQGGGPPMFGVVVAVVTDMNDPDGLGRVKVKFPTLPDKGGTPAVSWWIRCMTTVAGKDRGLFLPLTVDDEVLVAFEHGDVRRPYIVGALYNSMDTPPSEGGKADAYAGGGKSSTWVLKSTSGNVIKFRDDNKDNQISIDVQKGQYVFTLDSKNQKIIMHSDGKIEIDSKQAITITSLDDITIDSKKNVNIKAAMNVNMEATAGMKMESKASLDLKGSIANLEASGPMNVKGAMVNLG